MADFELLEEVIISADEDVGGFASAQLPAGYSGPCALTVDDSDELAAVFPDRHQAFEAARFAVGPLGGYSRATVTAPRTSDVTHRRWADWAFCSSCASV